MASSSITLIALFSLFLLSGIPEARKYPEAEEYSPAVANEVITMQLVRIESDLVNLKKITSEAYHGHTGEAKSFLKDFEPIPNVTGYGDDSKLKDEKSFQKDFEPIPNVTGYGDDSKLKDEKSFQKDFEPIPNVTGYGDNSKLKDEKSFQRDFEPIPNVTGYGDDSKLKDEKSFQKTC